MRKVITFLGKFARETEYKYEGQIYKGRIFAEALRQFTTFDKMLVFTTETAKETTWPILEALNDSRIECVDIEIGRDTEELWSLFSKLTQQVEEDDEVIFDITHGLRSIPFLIFLAAAYLKEVRNIQIDKIYYGAFELGIPAPVINLSDFTALLDWITATNRFIETGDGYPLADLLKDAQEPHPPRQLSKTEESRLASRNENLKTAAGDIKEVSRALLTNLVPHAQQKSYTLIQHLDKTETALGQRLPPYRELAEKIRLSYTDLAYATPFDGELLEDLRTQLNIITWYLEHKRMPQAITLIREWIVTAVGYRLNIPAERILVYAKVRKPIEILLNGYLESLDNPDLIKEFKNIPGIEDIKKLWDSLKDWRNLIDHSAHRTDWKDKPSKTVIKKINKFYEDLIDLAVKFIPELEDKCSS